MKDFFIIFLLLLNLLIVGNMRQSEVTRSDILHLMELNKIQADHLTKMDVLLQGIYSVIQNQCFPTGK